MQVTFDIGVSEQLQNTETFRNMMAVYVINRFDLPICRVAASVSLQKDIQLAYIINASAFNIYKTPTSEERRLKYEARKMKNSVVNVPSLQLATIFNLIDKLT